MSNALTHWLQLIRLPAGFSIISNVLVAHVLATQGDVEFYALLLTLIASLCLYHGGMVLNDCFDYREDSRDRPERPLPSQKIYLKTAWVVGFSLILAGCLSAALVNHQVFIISIVLAALILLYDSNRLPDWPGALTMGLCRYTNWLMALAVFPLTTTAYLLPLPVLFYVTGLTRLSQVETTGASRLRVYELLGILLLSIVGLLFLAELTVLSCVIVVALGGYYFSLILPLFKPHEPGQVQKTVGQLIFGLMPLDAAIGVVFGYWGVSLVILLLIPLPKLIGHKLYIS